MKTSTISILLFCTLFLGGCASFFAVVVAPVAAPFLPPSGDEIFFTGQYEEYIKYEYGPKGNFSSQDKVNRIVSDLADAIKTNKANKEDSDKSRAFLSYTFSAYKLTYSLIETDRLDDAMNICDKGIEDFTMIKKIAFQYKYHDKSITVYANEKQRELYILKAYIQWFKTGDKELAYKSFNLAYKVTAQNYVAPYEGEFVGDQQKSVDRFANKAADFLMTQFINKIFEPIQAAVLNSTLSLEQQIKIRTYLPVSDFYHVLGEYVESLKYIDEIISLAKSMNFPTIDTKYGFLAQAYSRKMILCIHLGRLEDARKVIEEYDTMSNEFLFKAGSSILKNVDLTKGLVSMVYSTEGAVVALSKDFEKAKVYFDKALEINKTIDPASPNLYHQTALANYHIYYGAFYHGSRKEYKEALEHIDIGLSHLKPSYMGVYFSSLDMPSAYFYSSQINHLAGNDDKAITDAKIAIDYSKKFRKKVATANAYAQLGWIYYDKHNFKESKREFEEALSFIKGVESTDNWNLFYGLGKVYEGLGTPKKALENYKRSIDEIEKLWSGRFKDVPRQLSFMENRLVVFEPVIRLLTKQNKTDEAIKFIEMSKSRSFYESSSRSTTDDENTQWKNINPLSASEIKKMLPSNVAILEYYVGENTVVGAVITNKHISLKNLSGSTSQGLQNLVNTFRDAIKQNEGHIESGSTLYNSLVKPFEKELSKYKQICIIPHGVLHHLPFHALTISAGKKNDRQKFLIENYMISYAPSATILKVLRQKNTKQKNTLFVAGNLPKIEIENITFKKLSASETEIKDVSELFDNKLVFSDKEATETVVKKNIENYDILLFSTHGYLMSINPPNSFILFNKDESNDGLLTVKEVEKMKLKANLITLSACQTGLMLGYKGASELNKAEFPYGDDLVGLQRGFMKAGAISVLSTLWSVNDDKSSMLVAEFFKGFKKNGKNKVTALHDAQMYILKEAELTNPLYWSPFILSGDWE